MDCLLLRELGRWGGGGGGSVSSHHQRGAPALVMVGERTRPPIGRRGVGNEAHAAK